ncbi:MAG: GIY-YIG nuclease family protein [Opitutaceae bacterium]
MHYVYLIESHTASHARYIGYSNNLQQRLIGHNSGKNVSTAAQRPWRLHTYLAFSSKQQALAFERYSKSGSGYAFANKCLW